MKTRINIWSLVLILVIIPFTLGATSIIESPADTISFETGGTQRATISSSGYISAVGTDICISGGNCLSSVAGTSSAGGWTNTSTLITSNTGVNVTIDSGVLFVDATNNRVGIGTTNPQQIVEIENGNIWLDSNTNVYSVLDRSAADRRAQIAFVTAGDSTESVPVTGINWALGVADSDEVGDGSGFFIDTDSSAVNAKFFIDSTGNVGIGTTGPGAKLDVAGSIYISSNTAWLQMKDDGGTTRTVLGYGPDSTWSGAGGENIWIRNPQTAGDIYLHPAGNTIFNNGNVGISTSSPGTKLHVNGTITATGLTVSSGTVSLPSGQIDSTEILDGTIQEIDLEATNAATDNFILSYDSGTGGFTWVADATGGTATDINCADCIALGSETTGNYAAGTAEAGAALTGDSATAFFTSGTMELARGGTGASLTDPNADRFLFWDDSAGALTWLSTGTGLSISGTTLTNTGDTTADTIADDGIINSSEASSALQNYRFTPDQGSFINIDDSMTASEIAEALGFGSSAGFTKVDDPTAPAPGVFEVSGYRQTGSPSYWKIDQESEYIFETWVKLESVAGGDTDERFYAGWTMYNDSKQSYGNVQRYWGSGGEQFDQDTRNDGNWYLVRGKIGGVGASTGNFIDGTEYARLILLINYVNGNSVTRFAGMKLYKSRETITSLYTMDIAKIVDTNDSSRKLVIDSSGNVYPTALTTTGAATIATGLTVSSGTVALPAGQIDSTEILDGTIQEIDLEATNSPTDNYVLSYDSGTGGFTWVADATGGTATDINCADCIALGSETTGNYVGTVSGGTAITVTGADGEGATKTVAVTADSIGDTQLTYNTGQALTTSSSPTFTDLTLTGNDLKTSGDLLLNDIDIGTNNANDICLFGDCTNAQSGNYNNVLKILGGGSQTRTLILEQVYNGHARIYTSFNDIQISAAGADVSFFNDQTFATETIQLSVDTGDIQLDGDVTVSGGNIILGSTDLSEADLDALDDGLINGTEISTTNAATDNFILSYDSGTGGFTWVQTPTFTDTDDQTLAEVLLAGNSAGATDINLNNNALLNIDWSTSDDGAGSGLDADTVDNYEATEVMQGQRATTLTSVDNLNTTSDGWYAWINDKPNDAPFNYMSMVQQSDPSQKIQLAFGGSTYGKIAIRRADSGTFYDWTEFWNDANDGAGSGLDADTIDGNNYNSNWATTLANIQSATSNDFHNIGGVDDDVPESGDFGNAADLDATGAINSGAVGSTEIADNSIQEIDLEATNSPTDNYVLSYDSGTAGFTWIPDDTGSYPGDIFVDTAGDTMTGTLAINTAEAITFESGKHAITYNDGKGNFNIRIGHIVNSSTAEQVTEAGYPSHMEWIQTSGLWQLNIDGTSRSIGDAPSWTNTLQFASTGILTVNSNTVWHAGNDGAGSGLNADTVDGAACSDGEVLEWSSGNWICGTDETGASSSAAGGWTNTSTLISSNAGVNISADSNLFFVDATNNRVGVGTGAPDALLDVAGTIYSDDGTRGISLSTDAGGSGNRAIAVFDQDSTDGIGVGGDYFYGGRDGLNAFWDNAGTGNFSLMTGGTNRIHIGGDGNVGIGRTNPTTLLHVGSNNHATGDGVAIDGVLNLVWGTSIPTPDAGEVYIYHDSADGAVKIKDSGGTNNLIIDDSGDVTIAGDITTTGGRITGANSEYIAIGETNDRIDFVNGGTTNLRLDAAVFQIRGSIYDIADTDVDFAEDIDLNNNALLNVDWSTSDDGSGSGLDADLLDGFHATGGSGNRWGIIPSVDGGGGVMEIGKYIDFHEADGDTGDYDVRLTANSGVLQINGNTAWHAGNDGSGSGLDADTIDGNNYNSNWATTLANIQSATSNDFHNIGGTDDDVPESGDFGNAADLDATGAINSGAVGSTEIADNSIQEIDLEATNAATDNYILSYDSGSAGFTWVQDQTSSVTEATVEGYIFDSDNTGTLVTTGNIVADALAGETSSGGLHLASVGGGKYASATASVSGAIKITLPTSWSNTMMRMTVDVYDYGTDDSFTVELGGYNYVSTTTWINTFATIVSDNSDRDFTVRFGHDGTANAIWIGETASSWSYPQVVIRDFYAGYGNYGIDTWDDGWDITFDTTFTGDTITQTETNNFPYADFNRLINTADAITDTHLAYNTGQHLTTASTPTFAGATISGAATVGTTLGVTGQLNADATGTAIQADGDITLTGTGDIIDFSEDATGKIHWYSNTYGTGVESNTLTDWSASQFRWRVGGTTVGDGTEMMLLSSSGNLNIEGALFDLTDSIVNVGEALAVPSTSALYLDGGSNTYLQEASADRIDFVAGGNTGAYVWASGIGVPATDNIYLDGGGDTYIEENSANQIHFVTGGSSAMVIASDQDVDIYNDLEVSGNDIRDSTSTNRITFDTGTGNVVITIG